ncbi:MFS transporter [Noviherbaspirillum sp. Root189]|uniref:MFS transporter n=1 Tax=Noviherbaspirillum sp. Root189 TaxID=1736487 RepID=UPI00070DF342|nr:MFS transporter [Noviherbaspirillum sp. Root189]KRB93564.1 hypothetical protein ASE07_12785 [Noviherbaspirillum sp. Root189]
MKNLSSMHPARTAGTAQGLILLMLSCLPVLAVVLLGAVLPQIRHAFRNVPSVDALAPLVMTLPALMIALLSPFAGAIVDKLGRRMLLFWSLVLYSVFGTAPLWLDSIYAILVSRAALGVVEAGIMTCCTVLIADYFDGARREKWLSLQTVATSLAATIFFVVGGALGEHGWRTPFWLYAASIVLSSLVLLFLYEPAPVQREQAGQGAGDANVSAFPWRPMVVIYSITMFGVILFFIIPVQAGFLLNKLGIASSQEIGKAIALNSIGVVIGAASFRWLARHGTPLLLTAAFLISGVSLIMCTLAQNYASFIAAIALNGLACGLTLPALVNWCVSYLPPQFRGRGIGGFQCSFFFGQFISPLVVFAATALAGDLNRAIVSIGVCCAVLAAFSLMANRLIGYTPSALSAEPVLGHM